MLLAIDIGNTNIVLGVFEGDELVRSWRIKSDARNTADELALAFRGLLGDFKITGISACSTVPAVLRELRVMLADYYADVPTLIVEPGVRTGVGLQYENPKEVGADRIVNTAAAYHLVHGPAIVVDFGTSTNFDVVSARGEFLGGVLAAGDRKSTRLNSSHVAISYAVFCLKKKKRKIIFRILHKKKKMLELS